MVLINHEKVVPEIKEGLSRTHVIQCSSTQMIDNTFSTSENAMPLIFQAPAQINFLHVGKEITIKAHDIIWPKMD